MKNLITILFILATLVSCIDKNPELSEERYKKMQEDYEKKKSEVNFNKEAFYKENKETVMNKINLFKKLKDSTTTFKNVNQDSTFYLKDVALKPTNFWVSSFHRSNTSAKSTKAVFLPKQGNEFSADTFKESYNQLYLCAMDENDSCKNLKREVLQEFLDIKYAFIIEGYRIIEPSLDNSKSFTSGLFIANIVAYDLIKDEPILRFSATATNSEEIKYREGGFMNEKPIEVIKRDFESNIKSGLWKGCSLHFDFVKS